MLAPISILLFNYNKIVYELMYPALLARQARTYLLTVFLYFRFILF